MSRNVIEVICCILLLSSLIGAQPFGLGKKKKNVVVEKAEKPISPVIFVPGDGGSQLEAKLNKPSTVHYICQKQSDWFSVWLNLELLLPGVIDCWIDNVSLYYDRATRTTHNPPGVEIRVPGWGKSEVVEWIDPTHISAGSYFKDIGNMLVDLGYDREVSLRGAPYDFRKAPNENKLWFTDMKKLIEDTYDQNNQTAVTLISHSMGSPMALLLLQQQDPIWKKKYIARMISLAGAWAGSMKAVKVFAMGDDLDSFALSGKTMRAEQITSPSLAWLLPSELFWKSSETIVQTPSRNYSVTDLKQYFDAIDYEIGWEMRKDNLKYSLNFKPPDVELHCLYGSNIDTVEFLQYKTDNIVGVVPKLQYGPGDGTVNARSLEACRYWSYAQKPNISSMEFAKADHLGILNDARVLNYIKKVITTSD